MFNTIRNDGNRHGFIIAATTRTDNNISLSNSTGMLLENSYCRPSFKAGCFDDSSRIPSLKAGFGLLYCFGDLMTDFVYPLR